MTLCCPLCSLRFTYRTMLELHAREDHARVQAVEQQEHLVRYRGERPRPRWVTPSM